MIVYITNDRLDMPLYILQTMSLWFVFICLHSVLYYKLFIIFMLHQNFFQMKKNKVFFTIYLHNLCVMSIFFFSLKHFLLETCISYLGFFKASMMKIKITTDRTRQVQSTSVKLPADSSTSRGDSLRKLFQISYFYSEYNLRGLGQVKKRYPDPRTLKIAQYQTEKEGMELKLTFTVD